MKKIIILLLLSSCQNQSVKEYTCTDERKQLFMDSLAYYVVWGGMGDIDSVTANRGIDMYSDSLDKCY